MHVAGRSLSVIVAIFLLRSVVASGAPQPPASAPQKPQPSTDDAQSGHDHSDQTETEGLGKKSDRMFGVLPNNGTVEGATRIMPISAKEKFKIALDDSFDPVVLPFVGVTAGLAQWQDDEQEWGRSASAYGKRYAAALADNTIGNFMTTAVVPSLLRQDPRYFQLGEGSLWHRFGYAASRTLVTRSSRSGQPRFNFSEIGGNGIGALLSNTYHPPSDRSVSATVTRWGTQIMWDLLANEMKEFWPDVRRKIRKPQN